MAQGADPVQDAAAKWRDSEKRAESPTASQQTGATPNREPIVKIVRYRTINC